jgi:hypothetical protein
MNRRELVSSAVSLAGLSVIPVRAQELVNDESAPLILTRVIPIPDTVGRFDHMSVDNARGLIFATVSTMLAGSSSRPSSGTTQSKCFRSKEASVFAP